MKTIYFLASELEPLVDDSTNREEPMEEFRSEYKKKFRPFSQYEYTGGEFSVREINKDSVDISQQISNDVDKDASWFREVLELRKKAGEYKVKYHFNY